MSTLALAALLSLVLTPAAARLGRALGLVDRPAGDGLKIHRDAVPVLGGLAVVVAAGGALLRVPPGTTPPVSVIMAVALTFALGLVDDRRSLSPSVRLLTLSVAGAVLAAGGLRIGALGPFDAVGTVLLVLLSTNAVNLVDGQDGLAGGLAAIAALGLAAVGSGGALAAALGLALAGGLAGFVVWNLSPFRVFLGNSGAYAVGTVLAALAAAVAGRSGWGGLAAAGTCLGIFALEVTFTVARRLRAGGLMSGDRAHTYDLLAARGVPRRGVTLVFWAAGAAFAVLGTIVARLPSAAAPLVPLVPLLAVGLLGLRFGAGMRPPLRSGRDEQGRSGRRSLGRRAAPSDRTPR